VDRLGDLFERLRIEAATKGKAEEQGRGPGLSPNRHPTRDFFVADILDWALKGDSHSMEHPMFSLSKKPDTQVRHYIHKDINVTITPSVKGMATIWDKDILIYATSQIVEAINRGRPVSRVVRLTAYDLLVATNRHTGGKNYERLVDALRRLKGTQIETNISTSGQRVRHGFGLLEEWRVVEKHPINGRMVALELTLSEWLYRAILGREILTLSKDYFRLDGGLERRLYELARKHCGSQSQWKIKIELLHKKSGSTGPLWRFHELLAKVADAGNLPDYKIRLDAESESAIFHSK